MPPTPKIDHLNFTVMMRRVIHSYDDAGVNRIILNRADFAATKQRLTAITGPSGSGKTTLLHLLGGIDIPDSGNILIGGTEINKLNETQRTLFRRKHIGLVFQFFNLIPTLNVIENLRLPLELCRLDSSDGIIMPWLERFSLQDRASSYPDILSGGEQQRIALIRAAIHQPDLILADEPTGNLDEVQSQVVLDLIREIVDGGCCVIMATHSFKAAQYADRHYRISHGKIVELSAE